MSVWTAYPTSPLKPLSDPIVQFTCGRPSGRLHGDRRIDLAAPATGALAVLVNHDIQVRGPLLRLVLREVSAAPAHPAAVPDPPDAGADVAVPEPHARLEHVLGARGG